MGFCRMHSKWHTSCGYGYVIFSLLVLINKMYLIFDNIFKVIKISFFFIFAVWIWTKIMLPWKFTTHLDKDYSGRSSADHMQLHHFPSLCFGHTSEYSTLHTFDAKWVYLFLFFEHKGALKWSFVIKLINDSLIS